MDLHWVFDVVVLLFSTFGMSSDLGELACRQVPSADQLVPNSDPFTNPMISVAHVKFLT